MKFFVVLCSLALAGIIFACSSFNQDLPISANKKDNIRITRNLDDNLIRPLLPRNSGDKDRKSPPSSSSRQGSKPSNRANQGLPSQSMSVIGRMDSDTKSRPQGGEASVNSPPASGRPPAATERSTLGSRKRQGHALGDESSVNRQRLDPTHRGGNPVLSPEAAQQTTGAAPSIPRADRDVRSHATVQEHTRQRKLQPNVQGGPRDESAPQHNSPDVRARLQTANQQLQAESQRPWRIPAYPQPLHFPERRLPVPGEVQNPVVNHWRPNPFGPNHPQNYMFGMAARVAVAPVRQAARNGQPAAVGQAGGGPQVVGGAGGAAGGQRMGGIQRAGNGALGAGAVALERQRPIQLQDIWPVGQASPSTASTQNHLDRSSKGHSQ